MKKSSLGLLVSMLLISTVAFAMTNKRFTVTVEPSTSQTPTKDIKRVRRVLSAWSTISKTTSPRCRPCQLKVSFRTEMLKK